MVEAARLTLSSLSKLSSKAHLNIIGNSLLKFDRMIEISNIEQAPV